MLGFLLFLTTALLSACSPGPSQSKPEAGNTTPTPAQVGLVVWAIKLQQADKPETLLTRPEPDHLRSLSPNGRYLLLTRSAAEVRGDDRAVPFLLDRETGTIKEDLTELRHRLPGPLVAASQRSDRVAKPMQTELGAFAWLSWAPDGQSLWLPGVGVVDAAGKLRLGAGEWIPAGAEPVGFLADGRLVLARTTFP
jgi:hypothetical protein